MSHICNDFVEELTAIRIASQEGADWNTLSYEERELFRLRACELEEVRM